MSFVVKKLQFMCLPLSLDNSINPFLRNFIFSVAFISIYNNKTLYLNMSKYFLKDKTLLLHELFFKKHSAVNFKSSFDQ